MSLGTHVPTVVPKVALGGRVVGLPVVRVGARLGGVVLGGLLHPCRVPAGAGRLGSEGLAPP